MVAPISGRPIESYGELQYSQMVWYSKITFTISVFSVGCALTSAACSIHLYVLPLFIIAASLGALSGAIAFSHGVHFLEQKTRLEETISELSGRFQGAEQSIRDMRVELAQSRQSSDDALARERSEKLDLSRSLALIQARLALKEQEVRRIREGSIFREADDSVPKTIEELRSWIAQNRKTNEELERRLLQVESAKNTIHRENQKLLEEMQRICKSIIRDRPRVSESEEDPDREESYRLARTFLGSSRDVLEDYEEGPREGLGAPDAIIHRPGSFVRSDSFQRPQVEGSRAAGGAAAAPQDWTSTLSGIVSGFGSFWN